MSKSSKIFCEYDYLEDDSDQERALDSSEDEIDVILHGTPKQKRKLSRSLSEGSLDVLSSGDEFEKEMEMGLEESMKQHEKQQFELAANASTAGASSSRGGLEADNTGRKKYYDDVYFDSDDEDEGQTELKTDGSQRKSGKENKRQLVQSNDDLFYDPEIDDQNQRWVDNQRSRYIPSTRPRTATSPNSSSAPEGQIARQSPKAQSDGHKSDAILNCPACMTTLCLDCQRHELYPTQYRAMFVLNCSIIRSERLRYKVGQKKKRKWKKQKAGTSHQSEKTETAGTTETSNDGDMEEFYHPVKCAECNTEVAVYDKDEVYHFFNVLSGIA